MKFKTNIRCNGCIQNVRPYLDSIDGIDTWEVDLNSRDRIMTVTGEGVSPDDILSALRTAGYRGEETD